jgi:hypothetical protein
MTRTSDARRKPRAHKIVDQPVNPYVQALPAIPRQRLRSETQTYGVLEAASHRPPATASQTEITSGTLVPLGFPGGMLPGESDVSSGDRIWSPLRVEQSAQRTIRGLPMASRVSSARVSSAYYAVTTIDDRGRLADRSPLRILHWAPGLPITLLVLPGAIVVAAQVGGREAVTGHGYLRLPAGVRHALKLKPGDALLVAAHADRGLLVAYPMSTLDAMVAAYHTSLTARMSS